AAAVVRARAPDARAEELRPGRGEDLPADLAVEVQLRVDIDVRLSAEDPGLVRLGVVPDAVLGRSAREIEQDRRGRAGTREAVDVRRDLAGRERPEPYVV